MLRLFHWGTLPSSSGSLLKHHAVLFTVHTCTSAAYSSDSLCLCEFSELHVITALCSEILTKVVHAIVCHKSSERQEYQKECKCQREVCQIVLAERGREYN